jgi:hypothetical protein
VDLLKAKLLALLLQLSFFFLEKAKLLLLLFPEG